MPLALINPATDCPLLQGQLQLAEHYQKLAAIVNSIEEMKPRLFRSLGPQSELFFSREWEGTKDPDDQRRKRDALNVLNRLAKSADLLRRSHYYIGFAGNSRAGKSSTINEVLNRMILPEGGAEACTGTATRLQFVGSQGKPAIKIRYMTQEEFNARVKTLAANRWDGKDGKVEIRAYHTELLKRCEKDVSSPNKNAADEARRLAYLLRSGLKMHAVFGTDESVANVNTLDDLIAMLPQYVQEDHAASTARDAASKTALQAEVTAVIPHGGVSQTIELVDLPGLGTTNFEHDALTKQFVQGLDGLLLFTTSENVRLASSVSLVSELGKNVDGTAGRVWLAVTKLDTIDTRSFFYNPDPQKSFFASLDRAQLDFKVPAAQMCLMCCWLGRRWREKGNPSPIEQQYALRFLNLKEPYEPPPLLSDGFAHYAEHFEDLIKDGGITRLREILERRLAETVREQVWKSVRRDLQTATKTLVALLENARADSQSADGPMCATIWGNIPLKLLEEVDSTPSPGNGRTDVLLPAAIQLSNHMWEYLKNPRLPERSHQDTLDALKNYAVNLSREGLARVVASGGLIDDAFERAAQRMIELAKQVPALLNDDGELRRPPRFDPLAYLKECAATLRAAPGNIADDFASLAEPTFFMASKADECLSAESYGRILNQKLDIVLHQVVHRVGNAIKNACDELYGRLKIAAVPREEAYDAGDRGWYDGVIAQLQEIENGIAGLQYSAASAACLSPSSLVPEAVTA